MTTKHAASNEVAARVLRERFSDLVNYESDDPSAPIDPLTYKTPEGDNVLHYAAMRGDVEAVLLALKIGIDVDSKGDLGNTAAHYAATFNFREVFDCLVDAGAHTSILNELNIYPIRPGK